MKKATQIVKELREENGFTEDGGNGEVFTKNGNLVVRDSFFYDGQEKLEKMVEDWTNGAYGKYFFPKHGVYFEVVSKESKFSGGRMHGKRQKNGVNELILRVL